VTKTLFYLVTCYLPFDVAQDREPVERSLVTDMDA
jgi:hypothetical protein